MPENVQEVMGALVPEIDKETQDRRRKLAMEYLKEVKGHVEQAEEAQLAVKNIIEYIGEDTFREGLQETPARVVASWRELFRGYKEDPKKFLKTFESDGHQGIVLLTDVEIYSMCEHHMLPFVGKAHIAYVPDRRVLGVSKLARIADCFARRLQIQERLGDQIVQFLMEELKPKGAACIIEAVHMCMRMRGCSKQGSTMVTSSIDGCFMSEDSSRAELLELIKLSKK